MSNRYEIELTITSAKDLKNVNWRNGKLKPYAVVWVDPDKKCSTNVDEEGDTSPYWDEKLTIPLNSPIEESTLHIDIIHFGAAEGTKPLIGSAKLRLNDVGVESSGEFTLDLKRPSGRPQGKLEVKVIVRDHRYRAPEPYYATPYGVPPPPPPGTRDYGYAPPPPPAPYGYVAPYGAQPVYAAPPGGYPGYGGAPWNYGQKGYGQGSYVQEEKKNKFGGMGTGLAVGAVAGALGGLALVEGFDALEDKIEDDVEEQLEDNEDDF